MYQSYIFFPVIELLTHVPGDIQRIFSQYSDFQAIVLFET